MGRARIAGVALLLLAAVAGCATAGAGSADSGASTPTPSAAVTEYAGSPATEGPPQPPAGGGGGNDNPPGYVTIMAPQGLDNDHGGVEMADGGADCANVLYLSGVPIPDGVTVTPGAATIGDDSVGSGLRATDYFTLGGGGCTQNPPCGSGQVHWVAGSTPGCGIPLRQTKAFAENDDVSVLLTLSARVDCKAGQSVCDAYKSQIGTPDPLPVALSSEITETVSATPTN